MDLEKQNLVIRQLLKHKVASDMGAATKIAEQLIALHEGKSEDERSFQSMLLGALTPAEIMGIGGPKSEVNEVATLKKEIESLKWEIESIKRKTSNPKQQTLSETAKPKKEATSVVEQPIEPVQETQETASEEPADDGLTPKPSTPRTETREKEPKQEYNNDEVAVDKIFYFGNK